MGRFHVRRPFLMNRVPVLSLVLTAAIQFLVLVRMALRGRVLPVGALRGRNAVVDCSWGAAPCSGKRVFWVVHVVLGVRHWESICLCSISTQRLYTSPAHDVIELLLESRGDSRRHEDECYYGLVPYGTNVPGKGSLLRCHSHAHRDRVFCHIALRERYLCRHCYGIQTDLERCTSHGRSADGMSHAMYPCSRELSPTQLRQGPLIYTIDGLEVPLHSCTGR